jgi:hypothetical protein
MLELIQNNLVANSVFDICREYGDEDLGYEMARCAFDMQEDSKKLPVKERINRLWGYVRDLDGDLRKDLYEVMRPYA